MMFVSFNNNTPGVTSGVGIANPPKIPDFNTVISTVSTARTFVFYMVFCRSLFVWRQLTQSYKIRFMVIFSTTIHLKNNMGCPHGLVLMKFNVFFFFYFPPIQLMLIIWLMDTRTRIPMSIGSIVVLGFSLLKILLCFIELQFYFDGHYTVPSLFLRI
jgi:hypothetical protein